MKKLESVVCPPVSTIKSKSPPIRGRLITLVRFTLFSYQPMLS